MKTAMRMMMTTLLATMTIEVGRFVTPAGARAGADANTLGVADHSATTGEPINVVPLGIMPVEAGAAVAVGAAISTDAQGRAVTAVSGPIVGRALTAASGAGVFIEVMLVPN